jgi:hypothetical protein
VKVSLQRRRHHRLADAALAPTGPVDAPHAVSFRHSHDLLRLRRHFLGRYSNVARSQISLVSSFGTNVDLRVAASSSGRVGPGVTFAADDVAA